MVPIFPLPLYLGLISCVLISVCLLEWVSIRSALRSDVVDSGSRGPVGDYGCMARDLPMDCTVDGYNRPKRQRIVKLLLFIFRIIARSNCRGNSIVRLERP